MAFHDVHLSFTGAGAPPPARSYDDASPRICSSSARHGRRRFFTGAGAPCAFLRCLASPELKLGPTFATSGRADRLLTTQSNPLIGLCDLCELCDDRRLRVPNLL